MIYLNIFAILEIMRINLLRLSYISFLLLLMAQNDANGQAWKKFRWEAFGGIGPSIFIGELGGSDVADANLRYIRDLDFNATRFVIAAGLRYNVAPRIKVRTSLSYGMLSGCDCNTEFDIRRVRNLRFRSPILEYSIGGEIYLFKEATGDRYKVRGSRGMKSVKWNIYGTAGVSVYYFNPKNLYNGKWVALQPLSTEGQGLDGGPEPYKRIGINIPIGIGFKYNLGRNIRIGVEFLGRKLFTDYVDDVSGVYYDNDKLRLLKGNKAADLADPNTGEIAAYSLPGQIRGHSQNNDAFSSINFTFAYRFRRKAARAKF